jgi:rubrerythrin
MNKQEIRNIIDFAIEKEQEAADFYKDLSGRVKSEGIVEELDNLAKMEMGHRKKLEELDLDAFVAGEASEVQDLKIANYTVDSVPHSDMSWEDVINIAMHRELAAANLYRDLAALVGDAAVKRLFENLAAEEQKHKLYLETIWDKDVMKEN